MNYTGQDRIDDFFLAHHGIKGQKWGIRRYQNPDGSLTSEGSKRYKKNETSKEKTSTYTKTYSYDPKAGKDDSAVKEAMQQMPKNRPYFEQAMILPQLFFSTNFNPTQEQINSLFDEVNRLYDLAGVPK